MSYLVSVGATFNGVLHPEFGLLTLVVIAMLVSGWLYIHWRWKWQWHRFRLDSVILLWVLVFGLSLLTNLDSGRRILVGLWYMGLYIGFWYVLRDILANRPQLRVALIDCFLIAGVIVLVYGYVQVFAWAVKVVQSGAGIVIIERPVSTFGNPNFLGSFLVLLIPFVLSRIVAARIRVRRAALVAYVVLAIILLLLAFSRGAWLGIVAGVSLWLILLLTGRESFRPRLARDWWLHQSFLMRFLTGFVLLIGVLAGLSVLVLFIRSFSDPIRSTDSRTEIYEAAVQLFEEKPFTGQGLFTFGQGMVRIPDLRLVPHSHAHNIVLHIGAELGLAGLGVLATTLIVIVRGWRENWKSVRGEDRIILVGAIAAGAGFAIHQLFDVAAMMPTMMLSALLTLALGLTPGRPVVSTGRYVYPVILAALWLTLLMSGLWSNRIYADYASVITEAGQTGFYRQGAERLQSVIDRDSLSLYRAEQAFLYGMSASIGDMESARLGVSAYRQFLQIEPGYAFAWANLAGLYWQLGEREQAVTAMREAERLDSNIWQYPANLALYLRDMGQEAEAVSAYRRALTLNPDARLYTELSKFPLKDAPDMKVPARVSLLMEKGAVQDAVQLWSQNSVPENAANDVVRSMLAIAQSDFDEAQFWLARAGQIAGSRTDHSWLYLGRAKLAQAAGDTDGMARDLEIAHNVLGRNALEVDDGNLVNIGYAQFLRLPIPRQFLPQVFYPVDDALLLYLLER